VTRAMESSLLQRGGYSLRLMTVIHTRFVTSAVH
jgi:hypothetical protein